MANTSTVLQSGLDVVILPVVEQDQREGSEQVSLASLFATEVAQRIQRTSTAQVQCAIPTTLKNFSVSFTMLLQQDARLFLLLPWCLQGATMALIDYATHVLQQDRTYRVLNTTVHRPQIHITDATSRGPLSSYFCVQTRLDQCVMQLPGWHTLYTCLQTKQRTLLLPQSVQIFWEQPKQSTHISLLEMALFAQCFPEHTLSQVMQVDAALLQDAAVYLDYLTHVMSQTIDHQLLTFFPLPANQQSERASSLLDMQ